MGTIKFSIITVILFLVLFIIGGKSVFAQQILKTESNTATTIVGIPQEATGWPVSLESRITQGINGTYDHYLLYSQGLQSVDIGNVLGTPIYSTLEGKVVTVCNDSQTSCGTFTGCNSNGCGYGKHVVIESVISGNPVQVFFGHFAQISVSPGQSVSSGTQIGLMGTTGFSTGPHLHWEFRGFPMSPPNIPTLISPLDCDDSGTPCSPLTIP